MLLIYAQFLFWFFVVFDSCSAIIIIISYCSCWQGLQQKPMHTVHVRSQCESGKYYLEGWHWLQPILKDHLPCIRLRTKNAAENHTNKQQNTCQNRTTHHQNSIQIIMLLICSLQLSLWNWLQHNKHLDALLVLFRENATWLPSLNQF